MWDGVASGLLDACCASDPISNVPPYTPPAERLASPPLRGSCSRPLFPDSLQLLNLYLFLHKFHFRAAVASASTSMGCILVRTAWRRGGVRLYMRAIREHPAPPDPPYRILRPLRSRQRKHARGAALPPFGRPHQCGAGHASRRGVSDSTFQKGPTSKKKAQKPVTLRNGQAIRGSEHSTPGRRISKLLVQKCDRQSLTATVIRSTVLYTSLLPGGRCVCLGWVRTRLLGSERGHLDADLRTPPRCAVHLLQGINSLLLLRRRSTPAPCGR